MINKLTDWLCCCWLVQVPKIKTGSESLNFKELVGGRCCCCCVTVVVVVDDGDCLLSLIPDHGIWFVVSFRVKLVPLIVINQFAFEYLSLPIAFR